MEKENKKIRLKNMRPKPENESPPRSWIYILIGVLLIFGLTYLFQEISETATQSVDPSSFEQLNKEVQEMKDTILELEQRIEDLEV